MRDALSSVTDAELRAELQRREEAARVAHLEDFLAGQRGPGRAIRACPPMVLEWQ